MMPEGYCTEPTNAVVSAASHRQGAPRALPRSIL